jgi:hypothetical protein
MADVSDFVIKKIETQALRDLAPGAAVVHGKVGLAAVLGGALSLVLCGQFGLGFTAFAQDFNHLVHSHTNSVACALICGSLFAVVPAALLWAICPPLQFKAIVHRHWRKLILWFGATGGLLAFLGDHGRTLLEFGTWMVAAVVAFRLLSALLEQLRTPLAFAET